MAHKNKNNKTSQKPDLKETTKIQNPVRITTISYDGSLQKNMRGATYDTYRELRKDPTIALARRVISAIVLSGSWAIEADEDVSDEVVKFVQKQIIPLRRLVVGTAMRYGSVDFGWQGYEKIFEEIDGKVVLMKLKPLLHDITNILVDKDTGAFVGYRQKDQASGNEITLSADKCLHIAFGIEGSQWYGQGLLENARTTQAQWDDANAGAARYDRKIAGSHFIVYYPPGKVTINDEEKSNGDVAAELLRALESSGSISIPKTISEYVDDLNKQSQAEALSWKVEILEDRGGRQPTFVDRLKYLDALKVRALGVPERSILEGEFGTKAEASEHGDKLIAMLQEDDITIAEEVDSQCLNHILVLNFGEDMKDKVRLKTAPLTDKSIAFLQEVYKLLLTNSESLYEELGQIDTDSLKDKLGVPKSKEVAQAGDESNLKDRPLPGSLEEELAKMKDKEPVKAE